MRFRAIRGACRSLACCSLFLGWSGRGCWWPYTDASCHAPWSASSARLSPLSERRPVGGIWVGLEATPRIELGMEVLQTSALPLGYVAAPVVTRFYRRRRPPQDGPDYSRRANWNPRTSATSWPGSPRAWWWSAPGSAPG